MNWYALYTRSNYERQVVTQLDQAGIERFWPTVSRMVKQPRRKPVAVDRSLLAGYVFARFDPELRRLPILQMFGVVRIISFDGHLAAIPSEQIESLRTLLAVGMDAEKAEYHPQPGARVRIRWGPMMGVEGFVSRLRGKCRVTVQIAMLRQAISVEVDARWLEPADSSTSRAA